MLGRKKKYRIETKDLAVPEIRTQDDPDNAEERESDKEIVYNDVAVPEIHWKKKN